MVPQNTLVPLSSRKGTIQSCITGSGIAFKEEDVAWSKSITLIINDARVTQRCRTACLFRSWADDDFIEDKKDFRVQAKNSKSEVDLGLLGPLVAQLRT